MTRDPGMREYIAAEVAGFRRTADLHGGFSNMAGGFPLALNGIDIRSSEALYQAMRYPDNPEVQEQILAQSSPMYAKRKAYEYIGLTRQDWESVKIPIMRHALDLKLCINRDKVVALFRGAAGKPIVEVSSRDAWWGAIPESGGAILRGCNVLGRLLMERRQRLEADPDYCLDGVAPPRIPNYRLLGHAVTFAPAPAGDADNTQGSLAI